MNILLVGAGNMGFSLLRGWARHHQRFQVTVIEPTDSARQRAAKFSVSSYASPDQLPGTFYPDSIVLAVKPHQILETGHSVIPPFHQAPLVISVAAGVTISSLREVFPDTPVIRCMPNLAFGIGAGMVVAFSPDHLPAPRHDLASAILSAGGELKWVDKEDQLNSATAISGSGPAYVFHLIECLEHAAEDLGLPASLSRHLARQTVIGAAKIAEAEHDSDPATLRMRVTSPGGTTEAALTELIGNSQLRQIIFKAAKAAETRGNELATLNAPGRPTVP